jgi:DNA-directed RNA polymerase alpha subunit
MTPCFDTLPLRVTNALLRHQITNWGQLMALSRAEAMNIPGLGLSAVNLLEQELHALGLSFRFNQSAEVIKQDLREALTAVENSIEQLREAQSRIMRHLSER